MRQESKTDDEDEIANAEAIDTASDEFTKQTMFARYFLMLLGCKVQNEQLTVEHNKIETCQYDDHYEDDFYRNYSDFTGLIERDVICKDNNFKDAISCMNHVVACVIGLLKSQMIVSDDILVLCFEYCQDANHSELLQQFVGALNDTIHQCLGKKSLRNYMYFKQFLLFSNVWFCRMNNSNANGRGDGINNTVTVTVNSDNDEKESNETLLFDSIVKVTDVELIKQKQLIWDNVKNEEKSDAEHWDKVCNFGSDVKVNNNSNNNGAPLRQDEINGGILSYESKQNLHMIAATMDENNNEKSDYDLFNEYNNRVYITQLLTYAHRNNGKFQNVMKDIFAEDPDAKYAPAPVKTYDRCIIKANTDYADRMYPSMANILGSYVFV